VAERRPVHAPRRHDARSADQGVTGVRRVGAWNGGCVAPSAMAVSRFWDGLRARSCTEPRARFWDGLRAEGHQVLHRAAHRRGKRCLVGVVGVKAQEIHGEQCCGHGNRVLIGWSGGGGEFLSVAASSYLRRRGDEGWSGGGGWSCEEMKASGAVGNGRRRALWPVGDGCKRLMRASYETEELNRQANGRERARARVVSSKNAGAASIAGGTSSF
jgi:hypothetical protein